ncbi:hypothetical protein GPECTOR_9g467 [Gonium pectorale]|uniref:EF-hand domain-containing protein n=1 Tax=Gonium pectorale TaxID=33097 RepID=A0A150GRL2_GONPE|nr:hypothetical protein GPECTOR_9g467 [Gonium pectorale]|eukprot:KXZ52423.1 hypothetical protein GPECTOR_9g467 [Gonium pectorale]
MSAVEPAGGGGGGDGDRPSGKPSTAVSLGVGGNSSKRDRKLLKILEELDRDGSGHIDIAELVSLLEDVARGRKERKYMCWAMFAMFVFGCILVGSIIGLTYATMYSLKDSEVKGGVMYVKNSDGTANEIVRTGSAEFGVENGAMVHRLASDGGPNTTAPVLQTAAFMGTPQSLNSQIDIAALLELKYLLINGTGQAQLGLVVHGVARVPLDGSIHGTVLHIVTAAGTITLDGTVITFSSAIANIFADAGFRVSSTRRALLGAYSVLGFFNTIANLSASGKPASQPEPKLPSDNFVMQIKVYEPCVIPANPGVDRCVYVPPQAPASSGLSSPSPSPPDLPPNATDTGNSTTNNSTRRALVSSSSSAAEGKARRRLRHRWVATAPHLQSRRHNSRILPQSDAADLAGVELFNGVRYMTHNETTYSYGGSVRVMYDFALYPLWRKIDVMVGSQVQSWQENVWPAGSSNPIAPIFCLNYSSSETGAAGVKKESVLNFTYTGVDSLGDRLARHFELFVLEPSTTNVNKTEAMRIDYWDSMDTYTPLRFQFTHVDVGTVIIDVTEFRPIDSSSPEAAPAMFVAPLQANANASCPNDPSLPRLSSPFMARGAVESADPPAGADPATSRRLIDQSVALAHVWENLNHVNGTGDWPQWALDMYGGVHPARRMETAARRVLGECGTKVTTGIQVPPCGLEYWVYSVGSFGINVGCGGNVGPVEVTGSLELDACESKVKGCISVGVGLPDDNWLVKKIGIELSIDIASACVGYNYKDKYFFVEASLILNLIVFKAELSFEMDFSSCCIWIASVTLEASVGVSFLSLWVTVGDIDIVSDVYLRGSPDAQEETQNPTAMNMVDSWMSVSDGYWGDWQKGSYPCSKFTYNQAKGVTEVLGLPMNSFQLRVEAQQGGGDDTALNGISVGCMTGMANTVESGNGFWGDWSSSASCPAGGYFVGAKMRIESPGGDDTAANSIVFTCSNQRGTDVNAHSGYWGDWTGYTYCPGETYVCGLQVRVESPGGDDTALNGLRIACCSFPASNDAAVRSATKVKTGTTSGSTCLDITGNSQNAGTYIQQYACADTGSQLFTLTSTFTGAYTITTIPNGLCVTAQNGGTGYGTRIILDRCANGARNQAFAVVPVGAGTFTTPAQVFTLDVPTRATTTTLQTLAGENNKCMDISGTNVFQLKSTAGFCATMKSGGTTPGTRIILDTCVSGAKNQLFTVSAGYQAGLSLAPFNAPGMCLDVSGSSTAKNCNGSKGQSFKTSLPV